MSNEARRKLLKTISAGSGAVVVGKNLPESWTQPVVDLVTLPAHAQTTPTPTRPVLRIVNVILQSTTLQINGSGGSYTITLINEGETTVSPVIVQNWIDQGATSRAGGGVVVGSCGPEIGDFQPGTCSFSAFIGALDTPPISGSGTFVAGAATARIELKDGPSPFGVVLDTFTLPVTLTT